MIAGRILMDCRDRLQLLVPNSRSPGLAEKTADLIAQLFCAEADPDQLRQTARILEERDPGSRTALKLTDLAAIFEAYQEYLDRSGRFSDPDRDFGRSRCRIEQAAFAKSPPLGRWFSGFTAQEETLLLELLKTADQSYIALCLDPSVGEAQTLDPFSAFARPSKPIFACKDGLPRPIWKLKTHPLQDSRRYRKAPALRYLEENFFNDFPGQPAPCNGAVVCSPAGCTRRVPLDSPTDPASGPGRKSPLSRYRRSGARYGRLSASAGLGHGTDRLPFFWISPDRCAPIRPLNCWNSALRAVCFGFRLPDMMAYLKTGLSGLEDVQTDLLDNYCRLAGIEGQDWFQEEPWEFVEKSEGVNEAQIDGLRRKIAAPLKVLRDNLQIGANQAIYPEEFVRAIWDFLTALQIGRTLSDLAQNDPSDQRFGHRQLWDKLIQILDELCAVYENAQRPAAEFIRLLETAFAAMTVKLIPPALDQTLIGQIERSRHPDIQVLFLLGVTQKQFPVPLGGEGLLGRDDRAAISPHLPDLAETLQEQLVRRRYLSYIALTRAARRVFLTRPIADEKGSPIQPWAGLETLCALFSDLQTISPSPSPQGLQDLQTSSEWLGWFTDTLGRDSQAPESIRQTAAALLELADSQIALPVRAALEYNNKAQLEPDLLRRIFSVPLATSISRLETFASCPYQHFASYILRLKKRRLVRLEPMDFGSFYHTVLDGLFKTIRNEGMDWQTVSVEQLDRIVCRVIEQVVQDSRPYGLSAPLGASGIYLSAASDQIRRLIAPFRK